MDTLAEHAPENAMDDPDDIARFYDRCSDLMRELLDELAALPDRPRIFPAVEEALGWPHRRIASVLGGVCHLRRMEFAGRRPYHFLEPRGSSSRRWEMWMDAAQARVVRAERSAGLEHSASGTPAQSQPAARATRGHAANDRDSAAHP